MTAVRPYLVALSRAAGNDRHAAMLGDEKGNVLEIIGDEETVRDPAFPGPGTLLSEEMAGANGIGTALPENAYVELIGPEHYIEGFHSFTCQGIPIQGPGGEVVGILSTSVRRSEASERIREILICAAHGVESELQRRLLEKDILKVITNYNDDRPLEELRQDLTQLQTKARLKIETAAILAGNLSKSENVLEYISSAENFVAVFKKRASLWKELISEELSSPEPISLNLRVKEMIDLLETETATKKVNVQTQDIPTMSIVTDSRDFSRNLFRMFINAFNRAEPNGTLKLTICQENETFKLKAEAIPQNPLRQIHVQELKIIPVDSERLSK